MRWSIKRLQLSYPHVSAHIDKNYSMPKRIVSRNMLSLVKRSPGRMDYFFKGMAYFGLGSAVVYSAVKEVIGQITQ